MGWKGTLRSINAAANQAQRASVRRQRELARAQKQAAQMQERQRAVYEVDVFENRIEVLTSVHKECPERIDWQELASAEAPDPPVQSTERTDAARRAHAQYEPRGLDKFGKRAERKREELATAVDAARAQEEADFTAAMQAYEQEVEDWKETVRIANGVLAEDPAAYADAFKQLNRVTDISELGSSVAVRAGPKHVEATVRVHGEEAVPKEAKSLLKTGRLSVKAMPKGRFFEIYQDYVCGAVLRVAAEFLTLLPIQLAIVTAVDNLLDTQTGQLAEQPILSVAVPRATLDQLNLERIDPSDSLANFVHRMQFKKTTGFSPVERVTVKDLQGKAAKR